MEKESPLGTIVAAIIIVVLVIAILGENHTLQRVIVGVLALAALISWLYPKIQKRANHRKNS